ncbi:uncharacterized protein WM277_013044 isoform 1-T3 [Molossus nigricans]
MTRADPADVAFYRLREQPERGKLSRRPPSSGLRPPRGTRSFLNLASCEAPEWRVLTPRREVRANQLCAWIKYSAGEEWFEIEWEGERKTSMSLLLICNQVRGLDRESNPRLFSPQADALTAKPNQPGEETLFCHRAVSPEELTPLAQEDPAGHLLASPCPKIKVNGKLQRCNPGRAINGPTLQE